MSEPMYSEYYQKSFSEEVINEAIDLYGMWCKENNQEPEVDLALDAEQFEGNQKALDHVLYHAEIQGLCIES